MLMVHVTIHAIVDVVELESAIPVMLVISSAISVLIENVLFVPIMLQGLAQQQNVHQAVMQVNQEESVLVTTLLLVLIAMKFVFQHVIHIVIHVLLEILEPIRTVHYVILGHLAYQLQARFSIVPIIVHQSSLHQHRIAQLQVAWLRYTLRNSIPSKDLGRITQSI